MLIIRNPEIAFRWEISVSTPYSRLAGLISACAWKLRTAVHSSRRDRSFEVRARRWARTCCDSLSTGSFKVAVIEQVSAVAAALCRLDYHGFCSIRGANI